MGRTNVQKLMDQLSRNENYRESDYAHNLYLFITGQIRQAELPSTYGISDARARVIERDVREAIRKDD